MIQFDLQIKNMNCSSCVTKIEARLIREEGVEECSVNFATGKAFLKGNIDPKKAAKIITAMGYPTTTIKFGEFQEEKKDFDSLLQKLRTLFALLAAAPLTIPMITDLFGKQIVFPLSFQIILATLVQFGAGYPFYVGAYKSLKSGSANMDVLVIMGTSAAYFYSLFAGLFRFSNDLYFETSAVLIALVLLGRLLENLSKKNAQGGMKALLKMQSKTARIKVEGKIKDVPIEEVEREAIVVVRPGAYIPVDGNVIAGVSHVDESMLTGESIPVRKKNGDHAYAGTINGEGILEIKTTKLGRETSLGNIIRLVENTQKSKSPIQNLADKISSIFVPTVLVIAAVTFFIWGFNGDWKQGLLSSIAVLVIACPCALGLAVPMVVMVACARGAQEGILVKNAEGLEKARLVNAIIIDKTGTVTSGKLSVSNIHTTLTEEAFFQKAVRLTHYSDHPVSNAITHFAKNKNIFITAVENFKSHSGKGLSGIHEGREYSLGSLRFLESMGTQLEPYSEEIRKETRTVVALSEQKKCIGYIVLSDQLKKDSISAVKALHKMKKQIYLLSGDRKTVVEKVAKTLGIDNFFAEVLPEDKATFVKKIQSENHVTGMVGDGINDAPALATADVGFAIASGTDVAMENATVGLMRSNLTNLVEALHLSQKTFIKTRQNLFFAFFYNCIGIPLAAFGLLNPMIAGAAMALSSISVILNSLTLKK